MPPRNVTLGRTCTLEGCDRPHEARGFCRKHYERVKRYGDPTHLQIEWYPGRRCDLIGCDDKHMARGLCRRHYQQSPYYSRSHFKGEGGIEHNESCWVCGDTPLGGGKWCEAHYLAYVDEQDRRFPHRRGTRAQHGTPEARKRHLRRGEPLCPTCHASQTDWLEAMAS